MRSPQLTRDQWDALVTALSDADLIEASVRGDQRAGFVIDNTAGAMLRLGVGLSRALRVAGLDDVDVEGLFDAALVGDDMTNRAIVYFDGVPVGDEGMP